MNENNFIYLVCADDATMFVDNSGLKNCNEFKRLVHVEFCRANPISRSSLLRLKATPGLCLCLKILIN